MAKVALSQLNNVKNKLKIGELNHEKEMVFMVSLGGVWNAPDISVSLDLFGFIRLGDLFIFSLSVSLIVFLGVLGKAVFDGWEIIPQKWEDIVEVLGKYTGEPLPAGLYLLFPWFGLVNIRSAVFKGTQLMELYLDEEVEEGYGGGDVEFEDCSSSLRAFLYFRIVDSEKSTYATNDLFRAIEEKTDSLLRSFLGLYKLEEVIKMKSNFYLQAIVTLTDFCPEKPLSDTEMEILKKDIEAKWKKCDFYVSLIEWGVEPISLVISDIELTESLNKARQVVLTAEKEVETAKIRQAQAKVENEIRIANAEADKTVAVKKSEARKQHEILVGEGVSRQIKEIAGAGIPKGQISKLLIKNKQWEAIEKGGNNVTIIEDGGNGREASQGAKFGSGFNSTLKK